MDQYDAIIIGTGQAGKPLAGDLADAGMHVAIIEKAQRVGGSCVVEGCTPTKTMVASARVAHLARRGGDFGVRTGPVSVDLARVRERKREVVESWSTGARKGLERHDLVDLVFGHARFVSPRAVEVELREGGTRRLTAPRVFINTGTRPRIPSLDGLDRVSWLDNASAMELATVPEHLVILGGGFIAMEFGQMFRRFGAEVTVIEVGARIFPREHDDVADAVADIMREDGVELRTDTRAVAVEPGDDGGVRLHLETPDGAGTIHGSHLMMAAGRRPNSDDLGLEAAGLAPDGRGFIPVDDTLRTEVDGVWALGDVTGAPPFTHTSYDDYRIVSANLLGEGGASRAGRILPYTLFIDPELGRVGMTESAARDAGHQVRVARLPMSRAARAVESDETRGFMKAVVDADTDRILGAAVLGMHGGEIATVLQVAMMGDLPWTALRDGMFSHPTLAESLNNLFATLD